MEQEWRLKDKSEIRNTTDKHPNYYKVDGYECWDVMEAIFGKQVCALSRLTNAFEYMWRSPRKGMLKQDLSKACHELELSAEDLELIEKYYNGEIVREEHEH